MRGPTSPEPTLGPETTGRYIVAFREDAFEEGVRSLRNVAGISVGAAADATESDATRDTFEQIGAAVVDADPEQMQAASVAAADVGSPIVAMEPERIVYAVEADDLATPPADLGRFGPYTPDADAPRFDEVMTRAAEQTAHVSLSYLRGYQDSINGLVDRLAARASTPADGAPEFAVEAIDERFFTWGLQVTGVLRSRLTGRGVRVAVLDTGFALGHPDFAGRAIASQSFIPGQSVQDGHGHGTHCIGTACGSRAPRSGPRYGVAYEAEIYAGKVLSNQGSGTDGQILNGINWAIANGCRIISMSLGARTLPGQAPSSVFEVVAQRALARGTLIIAAAGNDSDRRVGRLVPVSHPANCPSIMAVAAVDQSSAPAWFSNHARNPSGGEINIAAPGVNVISASHLPPFAARAMSGTSMATPHVAGIAALYAQGFGLQGRALWTALERTARPLASSRAAVGAGLVQAR